MIPSQTMFPMQNPLFFPFNYQDAMMMKSFQYYQMAQNKTGNMITNQINTNQDSLEDKKSVRSIDKSRDVSMDKSVSTIKSRKSKNI